MGRKFNVCGEDERWVCFSTIIGALVIFTSDCGCQGVIVRGEEKMKGVWENGRLVGFLISVGDR